MSAFQDATYSEYRFTAFDALTTVIKAELLVALLLLFDVDPTNTSHWWSLRSSA